MNLRSLRIFVAIMEVGTLARAAGQLNMSQSAASRQLQLLEQELGNRLFDRNGKRLSARPEAETLLPEAVRILSQVDALPGVIDDARNPKAPPLRVICHPRLVNGLVLPAISAFARMRRDVPIQLDVQPRRDLGRRMMQGLFDIGVSALPDPTEGLAPTILATVPLGVLLPLGHPMAAQRSIATQDLTTLPYIALDDTTVIRRLVDTALGSVGQNLRVAHEVSMGAAAYRLVRDGLGFTFADRIALDPELRDTNVLVDWDASASVTYGMFRSPTMTHPAAEDFEAALIEIAHKTGQ